MRLKRLVLALFLTGISVEQISAATPSRSHEEEAVRTAYSNLGCAAQVGVLWHAIDSHDGQFELKDRLALSDATDKQLRFDLSDFKVGELRSVDKLPFTSLVTEPVGILSTQYRELPVNVTRGETKQTVNLIYADVTWKAPVPSQEDPHHPGRAHRVSTIEETVRALRQPKRGGEWVRYASYSVVAKLGARSISYRATFLFTGNGATEEILPLDYATAMNIASFIKLETDPAVVANSVFDGIPPVRAWIQEHGACSCEQKAQSEVKATNHGKLFLDLGSMPCPLGDQECRAKEKKRLEAPEERP